MANTETAESTESPSTLFSRNAPGQINDRERCEQQLQADIDLLKDPESFRERFQQVGERRLLPAIEILRRLQVETFKEPSHAGFKTLRDAKFHLDRTLKEHLSDID
jgi:hypothetical protein